MVSFPWLSATRGADIITLELVALILLAALLVALARSSDLSSIPGPFVARFTRLWFYTRVRNGDFHHDNISLHHEYGPIVRYAPGHYSFGDPEAVKVIYGKGSEMDKSRWYEAWNAPGFKSLFTEPSVKVHGQLRRKFQATYSMSSLVSYEAYVDSCIGVLCKRFEEFAGSGSEIDLAHWMLCYAADAVSTITYSKRMGFLDAGEDVDDLFKNLHGNILYSTLTGIYAWIHPFIFHTQGWLRKAGLTTGTPRMFIVDYTTDRISEKKMERAQGEKATVDPHDENAPRDFLSKFLDSHEADPTKFTERDINIGLIGNIIAGSDTNASALTAILYCLLKHPRCFAKLREEISSSRHVGELSSPPTFKQTQSLPYLQAVVQESMRLFPAVGLPLQRVVPPGGVQISGHFISAGSVVGVNPWVFHYSTAIFGADAAYFRPERWLEADKETLADMNRHWMPFGLGSRTCIGKNISLLEIGKLMPVLVNTFEFELMDGLADEGKQMEWVNHWFVRPVELAVQVKLREKH